VPFRVHIVDEDSARCEAAAALLGAHGFRSLCYRTADDLPGEGEARGCLLVSLADRGGGEHLDEIGARGVELPLVVVGAAGDVGSAVRAMKLGAVDFLERPVAEGALVAAVRRAQEALGPGCSRRRSRRAAAARIECLSPRERQILRGLAGGLSNKEIARHLGLSPRTVEMHRASMMADLGISSLPEAVRLAVDAELRPLQEDEAGAAEPEGFTQELEEPLAAITGFARGLRERLGPAAPADEAALREALVGVERSAALAIEIASRIGRSWGRS
jgi:FixJ family two-component response regulator